MYEISHPVIFILGIDKGGLKMLRRLLKTVAPDLSLAAAIARIGDGRVTTTDYKRGAVIYRVGETAASVFFVQSGSVKISVDAHGKEATIAVLGAEQFFGEGCLIGTPRRLDTARALEPSVITRLSKTLMMIAMEDDRKFASAFMLDVLKQNERVTADMVNLLFNSTKRRLATILLRLSNYGPGDDLKPITTDIKQETLAELAGTTRETISKHMNEFRRLGFIEYNGALTVKRGLLNVVMYDSLPAAQKRKGGSQRP